MTRVHIFGLIIMLSILACGEIDYQEDWLGTWYETDSGIEMTFHENGTWAAKVDVGGIKVEIDRMGSYSVDKESYVLTIFDNDILDIDGGTETGSWKRNGDTLELIADNGEATILRKVG